MSKVNEALAAFDSGCNCSQAIFSTYSPEYGVNAEMAQKIACGFGAGMGRLGKTCGAVSGAYMLISLLHGEDKEKTYSLIQEFSKRFIERNQTTECNELLGVDLITGDKQTATGRVAKICPHLVRDAAEIFEDIMNH